MVWKVTLHFFDHTRMTTEIFIEHVEARDYKEAARIAEQYHHTEGPSGGELSVYAVECICKNLRFSG